MFYTRTRLETEAKGNSEIAYLTKSPGKMNIACYPFVSTYFVQNRCTS